MMAKPWGCTTADGEMPFHEPFDSFDPASPAHQSTLPYCKRKTSRLDPLYILHTHIHKCQNNNYWKSDLLRRNVCVCVFSCLFSLWV